MNFLWLTILFPLVGFFLLAFSAGRWSEKVSAVLGVGTVGITALLTAVIGVDFFSQGQPAFTQRLWGWIQSDHFTVTVSLVLDGFSLTMMSVVTGVGFLIHLYASWYMRGEEGYSRFFAYTNLFIASMLILVLADNLLLMYLGWEGVGLCSYLLIGFYYTQRKNGQAAMKAFIVTRIGDVFLAIAIFILYQALGTLNFHDMSALASAPTGSDKVMLSWATLLLLGGAVGKSAQLPLQTWLADAMAGPTPVSALIHAATMVTAGVYLIARTHGLFLLTPDILYLVGVIGAVTLVLAGFAALVQTDIKRILAYSTMSQIGYMFLALGVQAWDAAIFHLMIHAFFKALLFLSAGSVILACHHEQNIFRMGGLRKQMPLIYLCFLAGGSALAALPLVSAGFYSKDQILFSVLASGHPGLLCAGLAGTLLTSLYIFRLIFVAFHGEEKNDVRQVGGMAHHLPLLVLLVLSTFIGALIKLPLETVLPVNHFGVTGKTVLEIGASVITLTGVLFAAVLWCGRRALVTQLARNRIGRLLSQWWLAGWGFDRIYHILIVCPWQIIARLLSSDPLNKLMNMPAVVFVVTGRRLAISENGYLRWYIASMGGGAVVIVALILLL